VICGVCGGDRISHKVVYPAGQPKLRLEGAICDDCGSDVARGWLGRSRLLIQRERGRDTVFIDGKEQPAPSRATSSQASRASAGRFGSSWAWLRPATR
jgi:hypothetical protein